MALFLDPNNQGGGIVAEENSEQGIHINSDSSWYIESKYNGLEGQTINTRLMTEGPYFSIYQYLGDFNNSPEIKATIGLGAAGAVSLSGTYPESEGVEQQPRIGLGSGQEALKLEVEYNSTAQSNGIYINSANTEKAGISFVDNTVDPENPSKRYYLKDFALKSELSNVDLTNYQGDWKLTKQVLLEGSPVYTFQSLTYATNFESESGLLSFFNSNNDMINQLGLALEGSYFCNDSNIFGFIGNTTAGPTSLIELKQTNYIDSIYSIYANTQTTAERTYTESTEVVRSTLNIQYGGISLESSSRENSELTKYSIAVYSDMMGHGNQLGIWFKDETIQIDSFSLKSLVDRIVALETQVSELQTQLATKANTNSPTFTGKVTINSITE